MTQQPSLSQDLGWTRVSRAFIWGQACNANVVISGNLSGTRLNELQKRRPALQEKWTGSSLPGTCLGLEELAAAGTEVQTRKVAGRKEKIWRNLRPGWTGETQGVQRSAPLAGKGEGNLLRRTLFTGENQCLVVWVLYRNQSHKELGGLLWVTFHPQITIAPIVQVSPNHCKTIVSELVSLPYRFLLTMTTKGPSLTHKLWGLI